MKARKKPAKPRKCPTTRAALTALERRVIRLEQAVERIRQWGDPEGGIE